MKTADYRKFIVSTLILVLAQVACAILGAPVRSVPDSKELFEIYKLPDILDRGETGSFSLKTSPKNICFGEIIYDKMETSESEAIDLPDLEADINGICQWTWVVPFDAKPGTATFWASVKQDNVHDSIGPQTFCIEKCPWGVPTDQP